MSANALAILGVILGTGGFLTQGVSLYKARQDARVSVKSAATEDRKVDLQWVQQALDAQAAALANLQTENATLRQRTIDLQSRVQECENDRAVLHQQVDGLKRRLDSGGTP